MLQSPICTVLVRHPCESYSRRPAASGRKLLLEMDGILDHCQAVLRRFPLQSMLLLTCFSRFIVYINSVCSLLLAKQEDLLRLCQLFWCAL